MRKYLRFSTVLTTSVVSLFTFTLASPSCWAVFVYFDGSSSSDFQLAANWSPEIAPGANLFDIYSIDDGLSSTFSGGTTTVKGLRVGSAAKEHQLGETHFGRLTMSGGSLNVIGAGSQGFFSVGRERENNIFGGDYNKNSIVDAADYTVWRDTLGSTSDLRADGIADGTINQADYDFWKSRFGNVVKGGEFILTGASTVTANGTIIGERTKGLLSIGPSALVDLRTWVTIEEPNHFGGTEDMRIGSYGPAFDDFGTEPGLDGDGLVNVQGTLNAKDLYVSEHGGKAEIRLSGGTVNMNGELIMNACGNCVTDPLLLAKRLAKVSIVGSGGSFKVGLDPDPMVVDPSLTLHRDITANSPTAIFSFTADVGGVTPIVVAENVGEISGTAKIEGSQLWLNLDAYTSLSPLMLIDAAPGHLALGDFGTIKFLGSRTANVVYDRPNGNVYLNNFQNGAGAGSLAGSAVPEPSGLMLFALALGLSMIFIHERAMPQLAPALEDVRD